MKHRYFMAFYQYLRHFLLKVFVLYSDVLVGFEWSNDPESYVGSTIAIGRSKGMTQTKRDTVILQVEGWGLRLTAPLP